MAVRAAQRVFAITLLLGGAVAIAGCAGLEASPMSPGDANLKASVLERLQDDEIVSEQGIGVRASDGVVTLTGSIEDPGVRARAMSIANGSPGVRQVVDRLGP